MTVSEGYVVRCSATGPQCRRCSLCGRWTRPATSRQRCCCLHRWPPADKTLSRWPWVASRSHHPCIVRAVGGPPRTDGATRQRHGRPLAANDCLQRRTR